MTKLTDYLYDLIQNSINANANRIILEISYRKEILYVRIIDDGIGMDKKTLEKVRTFSYTSNKNRSVGLGLSMIHDLTKLTEGSFQIDSTENQGTILSLTFNDKHIDFPEVGDLALLVSDLYMHQSLNAFTLRYQIEHSKFAYGLTQELLSEKRSYQMKKTIEKDISLKIKKLRDKYENS